MFLYDNTGQMLINMDWIDLVRIERRNGNKFLVWGESQDKARIGRLLGQYHTLSDAQGRLEFIQEACNK